MCIGQKDITKINLSAKQDDYLQFGVLSVNERHRIIIVVNIDTTLIDTIQATEIKLQFFFTARY